MGLALVIQLLRQLGDGPRVDGRQLLARLPLALQLSAQRLLLGAHSIERTQEVVAFIALTADLCVELRHRERVGLVLLVARLAYPRQRLLHLRAPLRGQLAPRRPGQPLLQRAQPALVVAHVRPHQDLANARHLGWLARVRSCRRWRRLDRRRHRSHAHRRRFRHIAGPARHLLTRHMVAPTGFALRQRMCDPGALPPLHASPLRRRSSPLVAS